MGWRATAPRPASSRTGPSIDMHAGSWRRLLGGPRGSARVEALKNQQASWRHAEHPGGMCLLQELLVRLHHSCKPQQRQMIHHKYGYGLDRHAAAATVHLALQPGSTSKPPCLLHMLGKGCRHVAPVCWAVQNAVDRCMPSRVHLLWQQYRVTTPAMTHPCARSMGVCDCGSRETLPACYWCRLSGHIHV